MNTGKTLFQHALSYGIALGITLSVFEIIGYYLGIITKPILSFINMAITVSMLIVAIRKFRDQINNGILSFGNGFLIGLFICLIAGSIFGFQIYRILLNSGN